MSETATAEEKGFKVGERSIIDIIKDLSKPVAQKHLRTKKQGGTQIAFISWFDRIKYLDYYAPGWSNEIKRIESIGGKLIIVVAISIPCAEGTITREATGQENEEKDTFGDASSNAEAMALSRASAKFGLGLYLYSK
jgi:hypothetical protein